MATLHDMRRLLAFDDWANDQVLRALEPLEPTLGRAVAWMAHVMAAKRLWYARVTQSAAPFGVNPDLTLSAVRGQLHEAHGDWSRYLAEMTDADLTRVIHYTNLAGDPFSSTLGDILTHLAIHGQHHRGQCQAAIREAGLVPAPIDFIHAARTGAIPA